MRRLKILGSLILVSAVLAPKASLAQQENIPTIFTTENWLMDRELWSNPAYFRFNTPVNLEDMGEGAITYGAMGDPAIDLNPAELVSSYPYQTSEEHYAAWLEQANGGTQHTRQSLPDWSGYWGGGRNWLNMRNIQASTVVPLLTPQFQEYYVQQLKAEAEARAWWPASFCLPEGPPRYWTRGVANLFQVTPQAVSIMIPDFSRANIGFRWVETSGRGHAPEAEWSPNFMGESIGFWDGDALVVHTNQMRGWMHGHGEIEYTDDLTMVERYERVGDTLQAEVTLYDPNAFNQPLHAKASMTLQEEPASLAWSYCTISIGPSINTYFDEEGYLQQRTPMDPMWWNPTDPRPWGKEWAKMPVEASPPAEFID
jgi:hypothetical protein